MQTIQDLTTGNQYSNREITDTFQCSPQGGMRRSHRTNTLVLISNQTQDQEENPYLDRWENGVYYYTGMGLSGDQDINFGQNRTLSNSDHNGVEVHLFEVRHPRVYTYRGIVQLAGTPTQEVQEDQNGNSRIVWVFPLELV